MRFAFLLLASAFASLPAVAADAPAAPRIVSVDGEADVAASPDRATLSMSVEKLDPDLKKAEGEVNRIVRAYLAEAKALGAKDEQISTTGASVNPEYDWSKQERRFTGYRVARQIEVRVDALDKLGDFILRATAAGVNQVNPPMLDSSRRKELEREALAKAAQDAREKAKVLADTLGTRSRAARPARCRSCER
jgi:uncharacterized protein YggE